jgi:hypothetical protein
MGLPAERLVEGLDNIYDAVLRTGARIVAIPPLAAPGFVSHSDQKETERIRLAELIKQSAARRNARAALEAARPGTDGGSAPRGGLFAAGPAMVVIDEGEPGKQLDLWQRRDYLDDGLHLRPPAYDLIGDIIAGTIARSLLGVPENVIEGTAGPAPPSA